MEHVPLARGATLPQLAIPIVAISPSPFPYVYREDDFITFPNRHLPELRLIHPQLNPDDAMLSLAQTWLFFGTLVEFFRRPISTEEMTRRGPNGELFISTVGLRKFRLAWVAGMAFTRGPSPTQLHTMGQGVHRCGVLLARASWAFEEIERVMPRDGRSRLVLFSIKVILCSLCHMVRVVSGPNPTLDGVIARLAFRPSTTKGGQLTDFVLWDHMVENGWCPTQINALMTTYSPTSMLYLSSIVRRERSSGHDACLAAGCCKASQIDWANFVPIHVMPRCNCSYVSVDEQLIMAKLESNLIPLLSCSKRASGEFDVEVIEAKTLSVFESPTPYYAISHVWADGLGNPTANALTYCQFEKLYDKLRMLQLASAPKSLFSRSVALPMAAEGPVVFWMDVFCIPVERPNSPRNGTLKRKAIALMDLIYSRASQVLVLDSELDLVPARQSEIDDLERLQSFTESLARYVNCGWMGRSWTLQEGALSSDLWVQYGGRPTQHRALCGIDTTQNVVNEAAPELVELLGNLQEHSALPSVGVGTQVTTTAAEFASPREVQFLEVWNGMIGRSTTQAEDLYCILANLLDYSVQEVFKLRGSGRERIKAIILAQKRLPMQLFCLESHLTHHEDDMAWLPSQPTGPRLADDAFRHPVRVDRGSFIMEPACYPSCFFAWPQPDASRSVCLDVSSKSGVHPCVTLHLPDGFSVANVELLVYINTRKDGHPLVNDYRKNGAAFMVMERRNGLVRVKYLCSLTFRDCWTAHPSHDLSISPAGILDDDITITINGPGPTDGLSFRRPLRVGTNMLATPMAKIWFSTIVLALIIVICGTIWLLFNHRRLTSTTGPIFYTSVTIVAVSYSAGLTVIALRFISGPWIQSSYLTDSLPWVIRVIYWEEVPGLLEWLEKHVRMRRDFLFEWRGPLGLEALSPKMKTLWDNLRAAFVRLRWSRLQSRIMPEDYTDDSNDGIPLLPPDDISNGSEDARGHGAIGWEQEDLSHMGQERREVLLTIQRALLATQMEGI